MPAPAGEGGMLGAIDPNMDAEKEDDGADPGVFGTFPPAPPPVVVAVAVGLKSCLHAIGVE